MRHRTISLLFALNACAVEDVDDLGRISDGKGDFTAIRDQDITIRKSYSDGSPGSRSVQVTAANNFRVELRYDEPDVETRIRVRLRDTNMQVAESEQGVQPSLIVPAAPGENRYRIRLENYSDQDLRAKLSLVPDEASVAPEIAAAAKANLERVAKSIDARHLDAYGLTGENPDKFLKALATEYAELPDQYEARMKALGSMIFFGAPEILPPAGGKLTPFHGLNETQRMDLADVEATVFQELADRNGSKKGVRPFSVCETRYMIESYVKPAKAYDGFEAYRNGYQAFAATCPQKDMDEWYNFRGLGQLRPSWIEANIMDRFLRRMVQRCADTGNLSGYWKAECEKWNASRRGYRLKGTRQLASRLMFYDPSQEETMASPRVPLVLVEDRNGDGVGEFLVNGPVKLKSGGEATLSITATDQFAGQLGFVSADGTTTPAKPADIVASSAVHPGFDRSLLERPDFGLTTVFSDGSGCLGDAPVAAECPLLKRFYVMIDRHEDFYVTYSSLSAYSPNISSQTSPLVACSVTLGPAYGWAFAGLPEGGDVGFIFLMRIPFRDILAGSRASVATLEPGPDVTSIQDLYEGKASLDFGRAWLDIATLSNDRYSNENEISKFGAVSAEQIEGIIVVPARSWGPEPPIAWEADCQDGVDNDGDTKIDGMDEDCQYELDCFDGLDNEGDGKVDEEDDECLLQTESLCADGLDNDGDGKADELDEDCALDNCEDGVDNDGDGEVDEEDEGCG